MDSRLTGAVERATASDPTDQLSGAFQPPAPSLLFLFCCRLLLPLMPISASSRYSPGTLPKVTPANFFPSTTIHHVLYSTLPIALLSFNLDSRPSECMHGKQNNTRATSIRSIAVYHLARIACLTIAHHRFSLPISAAPLGHSTSRRSPRRLYVTVVKKHRRDRSS